MLSKILNVRLNLHFGKNGRGKITMKKLGLGLLAALTILSTSACTSGGGEAQCEMPPNIDKGKFYWIKFKTESKMYRYKVLDTKGCWVKIWREDENHYWYPIDDIAVITSKSDKKK